MYNLLSSELFRLRKNKVFKICILICIGFAGVVFYSMMNQMNNIDSVTTYKQSLTMGSQVLIKFIIPVFVAFFITEEYNFGTIRRYVSYGENRTKIYLSKFITSTVAYFILSFVYIAIFMILTVFTIKIDNTLTIEYVLGTLSMYVLNGIALSAIMVFIAFITRNTGVTISILMIAAIFLPPVVSFLESKFEVLKDLASYIVLISVTNNVVFKSYSGSDMAKGDIISAIMVAIMTFLALTSLGIIIFNKREIQ